MNEVIKTEDGDDPFMWDWNEQPFVLLLRVRYYIKLLG